MPAAPAGETSGANRLRHSIGRQWGLMVFVPAETLHTEAAIGMNAFTTSPTLSGEIADLSIISSNDGKLYMKTIFLEGGDKKPARENYYPIDALKDKRKFFQEYFSYLDSGHEGIVRTSYLMSQILCFLIDDYKRSSEFAEREHKAWIRQNWLWETSKTGLFENIKHGILENAVLLEGIKNDVRENYRRIHKREHNQDYEPPAIPENSLNLLAYAELNKRYFNALRDAEAPLEDIYRAVKPEDFAEASEKYRKKSWLEIEKFFSIVKPKSVGEHLNVNSDGPGDFTIMPASKESLESMIRKSMVDDSFGNGIGNNAKKVS